MASPGSFAGKLSPFRTGFLKVELYYDAAWQDITADLSQDGVTIERSSTVTAACTLALRNNTGKYAPRNPRSPLFGKIGRNTPLRISTQMLNGGPVSYRFTGEVSEWPQRWGSKGAPSAYSPIVASGILRRLGQGASPLFSPIRRALSVIVATTMVGYWPMEELEDAAAMASRFDSHRPATWVGKPALAGYDGFLSSAAVPNLGTAAVKAVVPTYTSSTEAQVRWLANIPSNTPNGTTLFRILLSGTLARMDIRYLTGDELSFDFYRGDGGASSTIVPWTRADLTNVRMGVEFQVAGADVDWTFYTFEPVTDTVTNTSGTQVGATLGRVNSVVFNPNQVSLPDVSVGHLTVERVVDLIQNVSVAVMRGHSGEKATDRMIRLCNENGVAFGSLGGKPEAEKMGAQTVDTLLDLLDEAVATGSGVLLERRDVTDLRYRTIENLYNQAPKLDVAYVDNLFRPFEPTDDDAKTRNRVTVQRARGSEATVERKDGPLSVQAPPAGVGVYDESVTLSLDVDGRARGHAGWMVNLGTHDEPRWPTIGVDLADAYWLANSARTADVLAADLGDVVSISGLPTWLPPDKVEALIVGYVETIRPHEFTIEWETQPARPYDVATYSSGSGPARYTSTGTVTSEALDTTETGVDITHGARRWGRPDGDYDIVIGGERMTVTAVTAPSGTAQTFTVVRSVNGIVKSHLTGAAVELAEPYRYAL